MTEAIRDSSGPEGGLGAAASADRRGMLAACAAAAALAWGLASVYPVNDDETWFLHTVWLTAHGYVPHRDFLGGYPGLSLALAPLAWIPWSPSQFVVLGRLISVVLYGASVCLAGQLVRARRWQWLLLAALVVLVMSRTHWFLFRRSYVEAFLLLLHLRLLQHVPGAGGKGWASLLAALPIGFACTLSQRAAFFLPIQPLLLAWVLGARGPGAARAWCGWVLGGMISVLPAAVYLSVLGIWGDEWTWSVLLPASLESHQFKWNYHWLHLGLAAAGVAGMAGVALDRRLASTDKKLLAAAWGVCFVFFLANPHDIYYSRVHVFMLTAIALSTLPFAAAGRLSVSGRVQTGLAAGGAAVALAALGLIAWHVAPPEKLARLRRMYTTQLAVLDWLGEVSGGEPVVAIDPYHPVVVPDATFLRGSWTFAVFPDNRYLLPRLRPLARQVLDSKPPLVAADPVPALVGGHDFVTWLERKGVIDAPDGAALRAMFRAEYSRVGFPTLAVNEDFPFGHAFWIRNDRLACAPIPEPHTIGP